MSYPKVSVIIPCYGVEKYLDRCMESVMNQTLHDIEIILIDDGSPDRVPEMCDEYARRDPRIKVIHKANAGLGYARNSGLDIATGEYVAFVDSDDYIDLRMYEVLYTQAKVSDCDAVYCGYKIDLGNTMHWSNSTEIDSDIVLTGKDVTNFMLDMIASSPDISKERKYYMSVWRAIYNRNIIEDNSISFLSERDIASEDLPFQIDFLLKAKKIVLVAPNLYYYCDNGASLSATFKASKFEGLKRLYSVIVKKSGNIDGAPTRCARLFVGYVRSQIFHLLKSSYNNKLAHIKEICISDIWDDVQDKYSIGMVNNQYQKLIYKLILKKRYHILYLTCKTFQLITKIFKSKDRKKVIALLSNNYAHNRLITGKVEGYRYKNIRNLNFHFWINSYRIILRKLHLQRMSDEEYVSKLFYDFYSLPFGYNILHLFNCINHNKTPWVISVESGVPWLYNVTKAVESYNADLSIIAADKNIEHKIELISKPECLGLLALSNCSYNIQKAIIAQFPQFEKIIIKKLIRLHPPQKLIINNILQKDISFDDDSEFVFCFVAKNFYRKGGRETIEVLSEIRKVANIKLILISSLEVDEPKYVIYPDEESATEQKIAQNLDWIEFYRGLPNNEVLNCLLRSHVCLLPTWMDTYAYSVLESQACGTPLITTGLRALPEINNEKVGWLIHVPVNPLGCPIHDSEYDKNVFYERLKQGLYEACIHVLNNRHEVYEKSINCIERIRKDHSPVDYNRKLKLIYEGKISELI